MRYLATIFLFLSFVLATDVVLAQQNLWQNEGVTSPELCEDGSVVFRYFAPNAESVEVVGDFASGAQSMTMREDGVWEFITEPLASEYYTYTFTVDGNGGVLDRENVYTVRDVGSVMNYFIVGGGRGDMYKAQAVPHGAVSRVWMTTEESSRRMTVYTPAGYEAGYRNYPVLYLLHGMGGDEEAWVATGRVAEIMDNLIAAGRAEPMIVVMPNGCMRHDAAPGYSEEGFYKPYMSGSMDGSFEEYFEDVVEWVDAHYRTYPSKERRAIAGLSMGGFHAMQISRHYPDMFDYVGLFSAAIYRGEEGVDMYENLEEGIAEQFSRGVSLYWIGIGKDDFLYEENVRFRAMLDAVDYEYEYRESEGGHTWRNWRLYLAEFAERLF
jgi:enterochelin esterase family protein